MMFCSIVGHASRQTAAPMGPSTIDRSNLLGLTPAVDTVAEFTTGLRDTVELRILMFDLGLVGDFWIERLTISVPPATPARVRSAATQSGGDGLRSWSARRLRSSGQGRFLIFDF
jgi:hypothetical protein